MPAEVQQQQQSQATTSGATGNVSQVAGAAASNANNGKGSPKSERRSGPRRERRRGKENRPAPNNTTDEDSGNETASNAKDVNSTSSLKRYLRRTYGRRAAEQVNRYIRSMFDLATFVNNSAFLSRCRAMRVVPEPYRVDCNEVKYTRHVIRILDDCSYRLMLADLDYNRLRKLQVSKLLERLHEKLEKMLSIDDLRKVVDVSKKRYEEVFQQIRETQRKTFDQLLIEYHIEPRAPKQQSQQPHAEVKKEE